MKKINIKLTLKELRAVSWFVRLSSFKHKEISVLANKIEKMLIKEVNKRSKAKRKHNGNNN